MVQGDPSVVTRDYAPPHVYYCYPSSRLTKGLPPFYPILLSQIQTSSPSCPPRVLDQQQRGWPRILQGVVEQVVLSG